MRLRADLAWLREQGIDAILSLTETPLSASAVHDFEYFHLPVADMSAPTADQFEHALHFIGAQQAARRSVAVHCLVGEGRTGTILAAYLIRSGINDDDAIARIRTIRGTAIGSASQVAALRAYARRRDWIL